MKRSSKKHRTIKLPDVNIPAETQKTTLPFNGTAVSEKSFSFSFACFDRTHPLFNLGSNRGDGIIGGKWFLDLLDCLKNVSNKTVSELRVGTYDLHPIDWSKTNTSAPCTNSQIEYWQFRVNKSKGRIIGFLIDGVFYIVWLDPYHNLTDSEGYGSVVKYKTPLSEYETMTQEIAYYKQWYATIKNDNETITE